MNIIELVGVGKAGNLWRHQLPEKATINSHGSRVLVVSPSALYWVDAEGQTEQATSYPRRGLHEDND